MQKSSYIWLKRIYATVAIVLVLVILATAIGYRKLHGIPDWYTMRTMTAGELAAAAHRVEDKLANMQNWAAEQHARESAQIKSGNPAPTTMAASQPANTTTIEFTEDELNAFFQKWVTSAGWADKFGKYVTDPAIFLQDNHVILAGTIKEMNTLASVHFEPKLDAAGNMNMELTQVLGGNLPLPKAVWSSQKDKLINAASQQLPHWQKQAAISPNGTANLDAVSAGMTEVLIHILQNEPFAPVIFLPVAGHGAIPARMTAVSVVDKTMSITVTPMSPVDREAFLAHLKGAPEHAAMGH
ncbi:MAG TPA: hypothetical protein VFE58_09820 [Tepidisphaeraceae bacterium]|jgi:hypothetical protein|nr:hypothetical protein [Tepidisphaeraceae bacterium]